MSAPSVKDASPIGQAHKGHLPRGHSRFMRLLAIAGVATILLLWAPLLVFAQTHPQMPIDVHQVRQGRSALPPTPTPTPSTTLPQSPCPDSSFFCSLWPAVSGGFDPSQFIHSQVIAPTQQATAGLQQEMDDPTSFLLYTNPAQTYNNPALRSLWLLSLLLSGSVLLILLAFAVYEVLFHTFQTRYITALEVIPRAVFAAIGAALSLSFAAFFIDLNNLLCAVLVAQLDQEHQVLIDLFPIISGATGGVLTGAVEIIGLILLLLLAVQAIMRLGMVCVLFFLLPLLFSFLAWNQTRGIGETGIRAFLASVFTQFLQVSCLIVGTKIAATFASGMHPSFTSALLSVTIGFGIILLTLRIPGMLRTWTLQAGGGSGHLSSLLWLLRLIR